MSKQYRITEFAKLVGRSASTVRRWEKEGRFDAKRLLSGQRYFDDSDVSAALRIGTESSKTVVYCRVSSKKQSDDLERQVSTMEQFCLNGGIAVGEWISEIGSGLDYRRERLWALFQAVMRHEVDAIIVATKDRLARCGFDFLERIANAHGCKIIVAGQESLSPKQELTEDLSKIVADFESRLGIPQRVGRVHDEIVPRKIKEEKQC